MGGGARVDLHPAQGIGHHRSMFLPIGGVMVAIHMLGHLDVPKTLRLSIWRFVHLDMMSESNLAVPIRKGGRATSCHAVMHEEVRQRAGEEDQEWKEVQQMLPVIGQ